MPEENIPAPSQPIPAQGVEATPAPQDAPQYMTKTDFDEFQRVFKAQMKFLAAEKRAAGPTDDTEKALSLQSLKAEIVEGRKANEAERERTKSKAIARDIDFHLKEAGYPEAQRKILKNHVMQEYGKQLSINDEDSIQWKTDELDHRIRGVPDLLQHVLQTAGGENFVTPTQTPGPVGNRGNIKLGSPAQNGAKPIQEWTEKDWQKDEAGGLRLLREGYRRQQGQR